MKKTNCVAVVADPDECESLDDVRAWLLGSLAVQAPDAGRQQLFALEAAASGTPDLLVFLPQVLPARPTHIYMPRHIGNFVNAAGSRSPG